VSFLKRLLGGGGDTEPTSSGGDGSGEEIDLTIAAEASFDANAERQRVTVWLKLNDPSFESEREQQAVFRLENRIMAALEEAGVGEHDTNSLETDYFAMRLYGDDADAIVAVVQPLLADAPAGSYLAVRHGPVTAAEDRVEVGAIARADGAPEG